MRRCLRNRKSTFRGLIGFCFLAVYVGKNNQFVIEHVQAAPTDVEVRLGDPGVIQNDMFRTLCFQRLRFVYLYTADKHLSLFFLRSSCRSNKTSTARVESSSAKPHMWFVISFIYRFYSSHSICRLIMFLERFRLS